MCFPNGGAFTLIAEAAACAQAGHAARAVGAPADGVAVNLNLVGILQAAETFPARPSGEFSSIQNGTFPPTTTTGRMRSESWMHC